MTCLFCNIVEHKIPASIIFEDEKVIAFRDINPKSPVHCLIIPKRHIETINDLQEDDAHLVGHMILTAKKIALQEDIAAIGYRLVFNVNSGGGQEVYHIHLHVLGGRQMTWPPG